MHRASLSEQPHQSIDLLHAVTTMHIQIIRFLFLLCCCLPSLALAATAQPIDKTIHVEWGYTPPTSPVVTGFNLYQEGKDAFVCRAEGSTVTAMDCSVSLTQNTTNFTLTATFNDGTESPQSNPFPFTASDDSLGQQVPPGQGTGSKLFSFQWAAPTDTTGLKGYRIYLNNALLCETSDPSATTIACKADLVRETMTFSMTKVAADGTESDPSNLLVFDPTAYPELFNTKQLSFSWEYNQTTTIKGFRIYQNASLICQTNDPAARQLTCTVDLITTPVTYTLTAVNADNTETSFSNSLSYAGDAGTAIGGGGQELKATIAADSVNGPTPLTVTFNGTASTGGVTGYQWDFGDGSIATTSTAIHTYTTAGTYAAKLTVANNSGATNTTTIAITASSPPVVVPPTPPAAVISSSTAAGPAPLTIKFDGSGSKATNATIASYTWSFGDGAAGTGAATSHAYTSAGTYTASLTVADSKGLSNSATTPVVVTPPTTANKPPQAVISATPTTGSAPLTVTFNGGGSTDSDGTISSYAWNFGDGGTASGKSVTHTYTSAASFTASLQVADDKGATGAATVAITAKAELPTTTDIKIETGEVAVSGTWVRVPLTTQFTNPIVVAGPPSFNNADPCTIRIRNVNKTGFDIAVTKWDYLTTAHPQETVSYLVMEQGHTTLPDGTAIEAGSFTGAVSFKTVPFKSAFTKIPVVVTTVASMNDAKTVSGRLKGISASGFSYSYEEQEKNTNKHLDETVHYIAWEPGNGTIGTLHYAVAKTANSVTDAWYSEQYQLSFSQPPLLLADMQTTNDTAPAALRIQNQTATGFQVKAEAEMSKNNKAKHSAETVGYITLDQLQAKH